MAIANAVMAVCQRQIDKGRSLAGVNLDSIVSNVVKESAIEIKVGIVFGELACRRIADGKIDAEVVDSYNEHEFASQELADAFIDGVEAASGYLAHYVLEGVELKTIQRKIARQNRKPAVTPTEATA